MNKWIYRTAALTLLVFIAACSSVKMQRQGQFDVEGRYTMTTANDWTRYDLSQDDRWTIDGVGLETLWTIAGLSEGDKLIAGGNADAPLFNPEFTAVEISEFVSDSLDANYDGANVELIELKPAEFGDTKGFQFELTYNDDGLEYKATARGAVRDGKLDMIMFIAVAEHFFERRRRQIDDIFQSVRAI